MKQTLVAIAISISTSSCGLLTEAAAPIPPECLSAAKDVERVIGEVKELLKRGGGKEELVKGLKEIASSETDDTVRCAVPAYAALRGGESKLTSYERYGYDIAKAYAESLDQ